MIMMIRRSLFALTSVILAVSGCDSDETTGQRTGTVFSCDNPTLTSSGAARIRSLGLGAQGLRADRIF